MELISAWLMQTYQFLSHINVPGFNISFMDLFFGVFAVVVSIGFAKMFFGLGGDIVGAYKSVKQRGGNNKNLKIASDRKGDKK